MRGRVGNKGGVGISLNIEGTTMLFINAHLAGPSHLLTLQPIQRLKWTFVAHEGKVPHRLANLAKIKVCLITLQAVQTCFMSYACRRNYLWTTT